MSDLWDDIQAFKSKQSSFRERQLRRKKEREEIVSGITNNESSSGSTGKLSRPNSPSPVEKLVAKENVDTPVIKSDVKPLIEVEEKLILCLCDLALKLPTDSRHLSTLMSKSLGRKLPHVTIMNLLEKLAAQELIMIKEGLSSENKKCFVIFSAEQNKLQAVSNDLSSKGKTNLCTDNVGIKKPKIEIEEPVSQPKMSAKENLIGDSIESLLSLPSAREKETKKIGAEILDLLSKPTAKERSLAERFRSQGGAQVQEFCPHGIKEECIKVSGVPHPCSKLHFKKIIQKHTDDSLGDCSFLNTCFHMDTCKYVHYEVDSSTSSTLSKPQKLDSKDNQCVATLNDTPMVLYPHQWIQCDLRFFDMSILGKFAVIMADPPWDIHMELPYGTMSDDEMRQLNVPSLQDEGLIFLWVTGRAMELGRECLRLWGYTRCDEIIWVKTNQLQRIIRTGRTGHWLNHGKEHCLVGVKGNVERFNRGLDCDVIVAEVRATSHKPDEIYGMIERLSPGTRKIELFGRPHNIQPNWITLGNQLDGVRLHDPALIEAFNQRYPDQNCMKKPD